MTMREFSVLELERNQNIYTFVLGSQYTYTSSLNRHTPENLICEKKKEKKINR